MRSKAWRFLLGSGCGGGGGGDCSGDEDRRPLSLLNQSVESLDGEDNAAASAAVLFTAELNLVEAELPCNGQLQLRQRRTTAQHQPQERPLLPPEAPSTAVCRAEPRTSINRNISSDSSSRRKPCAEAVDFSRRHHVRRHRQRFSAGSPAAAEWSVTLYDFDGQGCITKQDLAALTRSLSEVLQRGVCDSSSGGGSGGGGGGCKAPATLSLRLTFVPAPVSASGGQEQQENLGGRQQQQQQQRQSRHRVISLPMSAAAVGPLPKRRRHRSHHRRRSHQQPQPQPQHQRRSLRSTTRRRFSDVVGLDDNVAEDAEDAVDLASTIVEPPARRRHRRHRPKQQVRQQLQQLLPWPLAVEVPDDALAPSAAAAAADAGYHCANRRRDQLHHQSQLPQQLHQQPPQPPQQQLHQQPPQPPQQQLHQQHIVERHRWRRFDAMQLVAEWLQREPLMQLQQQQRQQQQQQPLPQARLSSLVLHQHRHHHHYHYHFFE